ncbi:MAG: hypothetical protein ABIV94_02645 [Acidimicrobiales bacterium]
MSFPDPPGRPATPFEIAQCVAVVVACLFALLLFSAVAPDHDPDRYTPGPPDGPCYDQRCGP